MGKLKIEVTNTNLVNGEQMTDLIAPKDLEIKIFNDDELVAETTLESLVQKFLILSTQYAQAMSIITKIEETQKPKNTIVLPGKPEIK